jgi:hypothetical protein
VGPAGAGGAQVAKPLAEDPEAEQGHGQD